LRELTGIPAGSESDVTANHSGHKKRSNILARRRGHVEPTKEGGNGVKR